MSSDFDINSMFIGGRSKGISESTLPIIDTDWMESRFMTPDDRMPEDIKDIRYASSTSLKFTDSSIGGNITINPRPQFTRYADPRGENLILNKPAYGIGSATNIGMGDYYSKAIDDNQQVVFLEAGLAKFNSWTSFFTRAIDYNTSVIANTGRPSTMYNIGKVIGGVVMLAAFPLITLSVWAIKATLTLFEGHRNFDYYYMEPDMHSFWGTVNTIVTELAIEEGMLIPALQKNDGPKDLNGVKVTDIGIPLELDQEDIDEFKELFPGIIGDNNYIDVFAIATRSQALANAQRIAEFERLSDGSIVDAADILPNRLKQSSFMDKVDYYTTFSSYLEDVIPDILKEPRGDSPPEKPGATEAELTGSAKYTTNEKGQYVQKSDPGKIAEANRFITALDSSIRQGGAFVALAVDYTGSTSESFSNSTSSINTGNTMKQLAGKARDIKFDFAGGNIVDGVGDALTAAKDLIAGTLDSVTYGLSNVIQTAAGGGYITIPDKWDDSSMSLPSTTYTMQCIGPYNHPLCRLPNITLPMAIMLAFVLPMATGKASYTSPRLCSLFSQGVQKIPMGIFKSVTFTRGVSNLAYDRNRKALAIDISFEVTDLSTMITAPVNTSIYDMIMGLGTSDDTPFGNYLSVLGGRDLLTNKYASKRAKIRASRAIMLVEQTMSLSSLGMRTGMALDSTLGAIVSARTLTGQFQN